MTRFYVCRNGNGLFARFKINRAISKAHAELERHFHAYSIRINGSDKALMFFRCNIISKHIKVNGPYKLAVKLDHIDRTWAVPRNIK